MSQPPISELLGAYMQPGMLLALAAYHFVLVVLETIFIRRAPLSLFNLQRLRDEAFSRFWLVFSAEESILDTSQPPIETRGSSALIPPLLARASGTVLDVGPGTGTQLPILAANRNIRAVYGAEPCIGLHPELRRRIAAARLLFEYHVLSCGAEEESLVPALAREGVLGAAGGSGEAVFDAILCVRVLCSVSRMEETVQGLYRLLRPGGKLIVVEHVKNHWRGRESAVVKAGKGSIVARLLQILYTLLGWSFFVGDCHLGRDIAGAVVGAAAEDGGWERVELKESFGLTPLPYLSGVLIKKRAKKLT